MDSNFVNIVGYQLEKVHTGVIRWLLDFNNNEISLEQKYEVLRRIFKMCNINITFTIDNIKNIICIPEYSLGRSRKIDLVVKIDLIKNRTKFLVIEMKVDSIPYENQLIGTYDDFIEANECNKDDILFLLFLFGTSQVCLIPPLHGFHMFRLQEILEVFSGHNIEKGVYKDWIQALRDEDLRRTCIIQNISVTTEIWDDEYWKEKGYRTWFPLFYYIYHELKRYSKRVYEWNIYSGQNNPVMNWKKGWLEKNVLGGKVHFYWEFNYEDFVLKVMLNEDDKLSRDNLNILRKKVIDICKNVGVAPGNQTQNRYGLYNSIYKWKYNFKTMDLSDIMQKVESIIDNIHPELKKL